MLRPEESLLEPPLSRIPLAFSVPWHPIQIADEIVSQIWWMSNSRHPWGTILKCLGYPALHTHHSTLHLPMHGNGREEKKVYYLTVHWGQLLRPIKQT